MFIKFKLGKRVQVVETKRIEVKLSEKGKLQFTFWTPEEQAIFTFEPQEIYSITEDKPE
jgi:hypothetical protein